MPPRAIASSVPVASVELAAAQQELERRGGRELRRVAEAAPLRVVAAPQPARPPRRAASGTSASGDGSCTAGALERLDELPGSGVATSSRRSRQASETAVEHLPEAREPVPRLGREVGAAEEGLPVRRQEHRHRPAALPRERDDGVHVDRVDVGPLFAVDLDVDEQLVHQRRGRRVSRTTRAPSRGTSGRPSSRSRAGSAGPRSGRARRPRRPRGTSPPGSRRAGGDRGWSPGRAGSRRGLPPAGA